MSNNNKQKLGQFYTTNYKKILNNIKLPGDIISNKIKIIEPFAGNGDLVNYIKIVSNKKIKIKDIICYDIEPKKRYIVKRDTLNNPPDYNNKYVITNPPYLARNKSTDKIIFDKYKENDLYKCFINILIDGNCYGGILIIPLNFWCSIRESDINLRKKFLTKYYIEIINIFEEKVFDDTSYSVCSFQFMNRQNNNNIQNNINCNIFPSGDKIKFILNNINNYMIGGEIYRLKQNDKWKIERATLKNKSNPNITNLLIKCIDDNIDSKICIKYVKTDKIYIDETDNLTARSYATPIITPKLSKEGQIKLAKLFNEYINKYRKKYNSLFLTNYRECNTIARKRISFKLVFNILNYILSTIENVN